MLDFFARRTYRVESTEAILREWQIENFSIVDD
jgi:hypothetical protein